jgi:hypothetical protein
MTCGRYDNSAAEQPLVGQGRHPTIARSSADVEPWEGLVGASCPCLQNIAHDQSARDGLYTDGVYNASVPIAEGANVTQYAFDHVETIHKPVRPEIVGPYFNKHRHCECPRPNRHAMQ